MPRVKPHLEAIGRTPVPVRGGPGILRLDLNESPDGVPQEFVDQTLRGLSADDLATYPCYARLEQTLAQVESVPVDRVVLGNGSDGIIKGLFDAFVSPGDVVLTADPSFAMYGIYGALAAARLDQVPYEADGVFPMDAFLARLDQGPRLAIVVNPNNPVGTSVSLEALERICAASARRDVLLVIDEAYFHFLGMTAKDLAVRHDHVVVLRTFSKLCGLAALRLGFAVAAPGIVRALHCVAPTYEVNGLAVRFGQALLEHPDIVEGLIRSCQAGRRFLVGQLVKCGRAHRDSQANFVMIHGEGRSDEIVEGLARRGVLVKSGFSQDFLRDFFRVTIGSSGTMERFWGHYVSVRESLGMRSASETHGGPP